MSKEKKRKIIDDKDKEGLVYFEIWGILLILVSIILVSELGPVGRTLNTLVRMIFGDWYWLILIFMFYYGALMIIYHEFITYTSIKIKGIIFMSAGLLIYSHFPIYNALEETINTNNTNIVTETYNLYLSYINKENLSSTFGGGLLGAFFFWITYVLLGEIGTKIIAIILLISGVAYIFEKTIYDFIDDIYFGTINYYKKLKKAVKKTLTKMHEVSNLNKLQKTEVISEKVPITDWKNQRFENIVLTKNEYIEMKKPKYIKPTLRMLKYHENKHVLESQKEITIQNVRTINDFLKAFHFNLEISEVYIGSTVSTYIIEVENSFKAKKIINYSNDLINRLETSNIRIYERYESKQCLIIEVPNEYRYLISLREILEEENEEDLIPIGRNYSGKIYSINFMKMANILIIGNDINSKIDLLKTIINVIIFKFNPNQFKIVCCDSTKFELNQFEDIPHLYYHFISDFQSMKPMLIKLYTEVEQRLNNIENNETNFTPILLILNDFVDFYINNNDYLKYLNYILVYGSKVKVYTIYATNNMDDRILTNNLRAQFDGLIAFMINSKEISFKYLEDDATKLLKDGDCLIFSRSDNTNTRVQAVNLTNDDKFY